MTDVYADLAAFQALPRTSSLALSRDGNRLVTCSASLDPKGVRWVPALWEVDPTGTRPAVRLTRSGKGETGPVFAADGTLLFTSARPDPDGDSEDDAPAALWALPVAGEAHVIASRPGGVSGVRTAAGTVLALSDTLPGAIDGEADEQRRTARKDAKVNAVLHTGYPVRYWDHDLGIGQNRLLAADLDSPAWRELTPIPGRALHEASTALAPDGRTAVTTWAVSVAHGASRSTLVVIDTVTGERRVLLDDPAADLGSPVVSPDGRWVAAISEQLSTPTEPVDSLLVVVALDGSGPARPVAVGWDRWPAEHHWTPDSEGLVVTADEGGRRPVFHIDIESGQVTRLTGDAGHYTDLQVAPDGVSVFALRDAVDAPPAPVRLDSRTPDQEPVALQGPPTAPTPPGSLAEVTTTAADGTTLRSWLVLPADEGPHPLVLWVHGGPLGSWNSWSWRWCPWLLAAQGYAVLLPDPA
ncbi:MAG: PD40 domain-containing protein, partial [Frankiales bacterium]|nr:PD40 domain-containing protein [Frankiales bacterium]